jgi:hypothetical protein
MYDDTPSYFLKQKTIQIKSRRLKYIAPAGDNKYSRRYPALPQKQQYYQ